MKKLIIFFIAIFFATILNANMMSMSDFRKSQRQFILADFKALYKKRNLASHKAQLKYKYRRVKKISHSGVLDHYHLGNTKAENSTAPADEMMISDTANASMQTEANHDLGSIEEHKNNIDPYMADFGSENTMPDSPVENSGHAEMPESPQGNMPDSPVENGGHTEMPESPQGNMPDSSVQSDGHTEMPEGTQGSLSDPQVESGGYTEIPENTQANVPDSPVESTTESTQGNIADSSVEDSGHTDTPDNQPNNQNEIPEPESNTQTDISEIQNNTQNNSATEMPHIRSLYANPWRRR